jgi:hypothetical protein
MFYVFLALFFIVITPVLFVFWQALMLFLAAKLLGVEDNTYFRSIKIVLWMIILYVPATLVYFILKWIKFPLVEILGGLMIALISFMVVHVVCQKYYGTGIGKNLAIFMLSLSINFFLSLILAFLLALPLGFWAYKSSSGTSDGSKSTFHLDKSFEDTAKATLNFGSGKMKWKY